MRPWFLLLLLVPFAAAQGDPVVVGILDTGIDAQHPELVGRVTRVSFQEGLPVDVGPDNLPVALRPDPDGRGTGVASLVAGETLGTAPEAHVVDLQVVAPVEGVGRSTGDAAADALAWLVAHEAPPRIVLLSFAETDLPEEDALRLAAQARSVWDAGILSIVPSDGSPNALAASGHVLTVAGLESCTGSQDATDAPPKPDLVAPSTGLRVAAPTIAGQASEPTTMASGSAYAAAQAAGAAAAALQVRPELPVDALAAILRQGALGEGWDPCHGWGQVDANATVAAAQAWQAPDVAGKESPLAPWTVVGALALVGLAARRRA